MVDCGLGSIVVFNSGIVIENAVAMMSICHDFPNLVTFDLCSLNRVICAWMLGINHFRLQPVVKNELYGCV